MEGNLLEKAFPLHRVTLVTLYGLLPFCLDTHNFHVLRFPCAYFK